MNRNVATAVVSILGSRMLALGVMAVTTPILVQLLDPAAYGIYGTLMAVFGLLMILVSSGINSGTRKYLAEEREMPNWRDHVFGYYFRLAALLAAVAAGGLVLASWSGVIARSLGEEYTTYFYLLAVLAVAAQFRSYARRALMGLKLEHVAEPLKVLNSVAFGTLAIGGVVLGYGIRGVLAGHILASTLVTVVALFIIARHVSLRAVFSRTPSGFPTRKLLDFNSLTIVAIFLLVSLQHVDVLILELYRGQEKVGYYRAALVLTQLLWLVPRSIQSVMIQSTSNLWEDNRIEHITELASRASRYTLLFTLLLAVGLATLAHQFVPIYYGEAFRPAVIPVLLLLPGTVGFSLARPMFAISQAKGDLKVLIAATGATALINLGLNLVLIPTYGMVGAAVATSVGYGLLPVFHVAAARRLGYRPFADLRPGRVAATALGTAIPIVALSRLIGDPLLALVVVPPVGGAIYAVLTLLTGAMRFEELYELGTAMPGPVERRVESLRGYIEDADGVVDSLRTAQN